MLAKEKFTALEFFAGSQKITSVLEAKNVRVFSLDVVQLPNVRRVDFLQDFLDFDYKMFKPHEIHFLFFGLPCNTFSKASGGKHWLKDKMLTLDALNAFLYFRRVAEIISYFKTATFVIENPVGAVTSKQFFKNWISSTNAIVYTVSQKSFGFPTVKPTHLITNSNNLILVPLIYRVKGRIQLNPLYNLSLKNRQSYPMEFAQFIVNSFYF